MQEISVKGPQCVKTCAASRTPDLKEILRERSVLEAHVSVIHCSCDVDLLDSAYVSGKRNLTFGEASSALDRTFEVALTSVKEGDKAIVNIEVEGKFAHESLYRTNVSFKCEICYTIITHGKRIYDYSNKEKLEIASKYKELALFKLNEASGSASYIYPVHLSVFLLLVRAVKWLSLISPKDLSQDKLSTYTTLKSQCYNNLSHFHLAFENYERAVSGATLVLSLDPDNVKALYRRAVGNTKLQNYELALSDLEVILKKDPSNSSAKRQLVIVGNHMKSLDKMYADAMKKFLSPK